MVNSLFISLLVALCSNGTSALARTAMAQLKNIEVKCGRTGMSVHITFDRSFAGVIFSKGHYYDNKCQYILPEQVNSKTFSFQIPAEGCGTTGELREPTLGRDMFFENTIIIQNDPLIQEVWDQARLLRCNWKHSISKSVSAPPLKIEDPERVTVHFDSRTINTLMQVQRGTSPFSSPASGYIYQDEQSSIVIYAQDDSNSLDANVVSCSATSTNGKQIPLVDSYGCVVDPNLMTPFIKMREPNGLVADMMFYSYFNGFPVDQNTDFEIICQLEVCDGKCLDPCSLRNHRKRRDVESQEVPTQRADLSRKFVVVTRDISQEAGCGVSQAIAATISILLMMVASLSIAVCYLVFSLYKVKRAS